MRYVTEAPPGATIEDLRVALASPHAGVRSTPVWGVAGRPGLLERTRVSDIFSQGVALGVTVESASAFA